MSSLKYIQFPFKWRKGNRVSSFFMEIQSGCQKPWHGRYRWTAQIVLKERCVIVSNGFYNTGCYKCMKHFCESCDGDDGGPSFSFLGAMSNKLLCGLPNSINGSICHTSHSSWYDSQSVGIRLSVTLIQPVVVSGKKSGLTQIQTTRSYNIVRLHN